MRYDELEAAILRLVVAADEDDLRVFGLETVTRLVREELLHTVSADELDEDGWAALTSARETVRTAGATELRAQLVRIDAGIRADDDLDQGLLIVISALEHWTTYLEENRRGELYELAIRSVEEVDFQVSADLDDVLATPEMAAEYARIRRLLTAGLRPPFPAER
ncbi:hypothetical protein M8C17_30035 [Micromonospora sp. RHAY321]|uniref:hypothetical protein n=1 Tax=Micromonospora sp. RHAY321 TaxID=2944807 RepID=UPI00207CB9D7|nr:hypothetical protein [Micromonospora sp. RHAY321]MCO1599403.1 hypothetical protein [Micromonospora sp. RHAY321]